MIRSFWTNSLLLLSLGSGLFCSESFRDTRDVVLQQEPNECAPATVTMLLRRFGRTTSFEQVKAEFDLSDRGASVTQVVRVLREHGLDASAWERGSTSPAEPPAPSILFVDGSHFIILDSVVREEAHIRDPATGRKVLSAQELGERWSGVSIVITGGSGKP